MDIVKVKNEIKMFYKKNVLISKDEKIEFLVGMKSIFRTGKDIVSCLEDYILSEPSSHMRKELLKVISLMNKYGVKKVFTPWLLEIGILENEYEKSLWESTDDKSEIIESILSGREKSKSKTGMYLEKYFYHILSALMLMSWFIFEKEIIDSFVESAKLLAEEGQKKETYIITPAWQPLPVFIFGLIYFIWSSYFILIISFGKYFKQTIPLYFRIQKHQEKTDLMFMCKLLKEQFNRGYNLHDSLQAIKPVVEKYALKPTIELALNKILIKGKRNISVAFKHFGFNNNSITLLKRFEHGGVNYVDLANNLYETFDGIRNKNIQQLKSELFVSKLVFWSVMTVLSAFYSIESYGAFMGLNVK